MAKCLGCLHQNGVFDKCCGVIDNEIILDPIRLAMGEERWQDSTCPLRLVIDAIEENDKSIFDQILGNK